MTKDGLFLAFVIAGGIGGFWVGTLSPTLPVLPLSPPMAISITPGVPVSLHKSWEDVKKEDPEAAKWVREIRVVDPLEILADPGDGKGLRPMSGMIPIHLSEAFWRVIFVNREAFASGEIELQGLLRHELVHVRQLLDHPAWRQVKTWGLVAGEAEAQAYEVADAYKSRLYFREALEKWISEN